MALNDNAKLNVFAAEAYADADRVCGEIKAVTDKEREELLLNGRKNLQNEIRESTEEEISRARKESALAAARKNTELRHDYLLKIESMSELMTESLRKKLEEFTESDEYIEYLKKTAAKILTAGYLSSGGESGGIEVYHSERDTRHIEELKSVLTGMNAEFTADKGIRIGGLKFRPKGRNILINETLDDKLERSADTLAGLISEHIHDEVRNEK